MPITAEQREIRKLRKHLRDLTSVVRRGVKALDAEMKRPATSERGTRVAQVCNALELANDMAVRYGLGKRIF